MGSAIVSDLVEIAHDLAAGRLSAKNVVGFLELAGWHLRVAVELDSPAKNPSQAMAWAMLFCVL